MAFGGNILQRIVRLIFDRSAAQKAQADAKRAVQGIDGTLAGLTKVAKAAGAAFLAAFSIQKIIQGLKDVSREAIESERIWNRLAGTLKTRVGVEFKNVEAAIVASARAMQDTTTVGDEQFAETLQTLVLISGDFEGSLKNVALVADLAAARQMDLGTAADLVGKAMVGVTETLKRHGIVVQEGADAIEVMREQFRGLAQNEAKTFGGRMDQLNNEIGDLKEEIGALILGSRIAAGTIELLTNAVKAAAEAIRRLRETDEETAARTAQSRFRTMSTDALNAERARLGIEVAILESNEALLLGIDKRSRAEERALIIAQRRLSVLRVEHEQIEQFLRQRQSIPGIALTPEAIAELNEKAKNAAEEREKARQKEVSLLLEGFDARRLTADEESRLLTIERQLSAELARGISSLERRLQIAQELARLSPAAATIRQRRGIDAPGGGLVGSIEDRAFPIVGLSQADLDRLEEHQQAHQQWAEALVDDLRRIEQAQLQTWSIAGRAASSFFQGLVEGSQGLGEAIVANLLSGFAEYLEVKAAAAFAEAIFPPNPALIAKGVALSALAGVVRGLAGRMAAGGRGSAGTLAAAGSAGTSRARSELTQPPAEVHINLMGSFGALAQSPDFQTSVTQAVQWGQERWGQDANFHINVSRPSR